MGLHHRGPWAQLHLERFKKGNNPSRFTLGKSFWEQHGEWIGRGREWGPGGEEGPGKGKGEDEVLGYPLRSGPGRCLLSAETEPPAAGRAYPGRSRWPLRAFQIPLVWERDPRCVRGKPCSAGETGNPPPCLPNAGRSCGSSVPAMALVSAMRGRTR